MSGDSTHKELIGQIGNAGDLAALEQLRVSALGKSGSVTALLKSLGAMDAETRATQGPRIHALREAVASALATRKETLEAADLDRKLATETLDLTLPAPERPSGTVHPISQVMDELAEIFADLGFAVAEGPEIESQWYNFSALNMPENHPARAMQDSFYLQRNEGEDEAKVLRTHTSPVQIRTMQANPPPLRIIAPGRVYRSDSDATHTPMFHQIEGLVIDKSIHMG
ncbi:MAG: phenylalanine--tRNA ligase subunit alpha, partial [Sphingomicrobium sp.]